MTHKESLMTNAFINPCIYGAPSGDRFLRGLPAERSKLAGDPPSE